MIQNGEITESITKRLLLDEEKIEQMAKNCESVASLPDPCGKLLQATFLDEGLKLHRVSCPIGVILMIFQ